MSFLFKILFNNPINLFDKSDTKFQQMTDEGTEQMTKVQLRKNIHVDIVK